MKHLYLLNLKIAVNSLGFYTELLDSLSKVIMLNLEKQETKQTQFFSLFDFEYQTLINIGLDLIQEGDIDSAILFFQELSLSSPHSSLSYFYLGNLHTVKDDLDLAVGYYSLAWEVNDNPLLTSRLPCKVLSTLISMKQVDKDLLALWLERAEKFVSNYECDSLLIYDFSKRILDE